MTHDTPPKRIWAIEYRGEAVPRSGEWVAEQSDAPEGVNSYTLTSEAEAMVAAALRGAAEGLLDWYTDVEDDRGPHMVVRALIPQPASAALDKLIAEAVKAERERCAEIADDHTPGKHMGGTLAAHVTGRTIANAIRAAKGDQK